MNQNHPNRQWYHLAGVAILQHALLKTVGIPLFIAVFFGVYFYLLKHPVYPATVMPTTWLDRLISFQPLALPLYVSLWIYVSLPPAFLSTRREVLGYGLAIAMTCLPGLAVFYFWPTVVPPSDIDWARFPSVSFLKSLDASGNACPSLHVATAVFSGVWLQYLLRQFGAPAWVLVVNTLWCAGIVYSTMAARQHVAVDVLAGLLLGLLVAHLSLRPGLVVEGASSGANARNGKAFGNGSRIPADE